MKKILMTTCKLAAAVICLSLFSVKANSQVLEWRLANKVFNAADPDGVGPAKSTTAFTLQIHTAAGTVNNVNAISTGYSYNSASAMVPTAPACATVTNPANITLSPTFSGVGFSLNINQCNVFVQNNGPRSFDRRASGTIDGGVITLTTTWVDVMTVTLWNLGTVPPEGGYVVINSGSGGAPAPFPTYAVADDVANEYVVNSLTFATALQLTSSTLPVLFTGYDVKCGDKGTVLTWSTAQEINSSRFEIEKSLNGNAWTTIDNVTAAGTSNSPIKYQYLDLDGGDAFYRIRQVDLDGRFEYTTIKRVNCSGRQVNVVIYPVPANNILHVAIHTDRAIRTELQVFDMAGRIVKAQAASLNNGNNNLDINTAGLAVGEYVLRSSDGTLQLNKKFTIAR